MVIPKPIKDIFDCAIRHSEQEIIWNGELEGFIMLDYQGNQYYLMTQMPPPEWRTNLAYWIRMASTSIGALALVQLADCWMAPKQDKFGSILSPSEHPDRIETAMVALTFRHCDKLYACVSSRSIERGALGTVTGLGAEWDKGNDLKPYLVRKNGRFSDLITPTAPSAAERKQASAALAGYSNFFDAAALLAIPPGADFHQIARQHQEKFRNRIRSTVH